MFEGLTELSRAFVLKKKCLQADMYWKQKYEEYLQRSDDTLETDSQNSKDHGCQSKDPQAGPDGLQEKIKLVFPKALYCRVKGAAGIVS